MPNNRMTWEKMEKELKEARKDPEFRKELKRFIAITSGRARKKLK